MGIQRCDDEIRGIMLHGRAERLLKMYCGDLKRLYGLSQPEVIRNLRYLISNKWIDVECVSKG